MKQYPSIPYWNTDIIGQDCIAFDKMDGSNLRFEWSNKSGWYKFGTRTQLIDAKNEQFGKAIPIFLEKYSEPLAKIFTDKYKKIPNFVVFCEYFGENSFAGQHDPNDKMDLTLFDVSVYKKGLIVPHEFVENFGDTGIPKIVYSGKLTESFIEDVKQNNFNLIEGVMCKGVLKKAKKSDQLFIAKVKTQEWIDKVKKLHGIAAVKSELNGNQKLIDIFNI